MKKTIVAAAASVLFALPAIAQTTTTADDPVDVSTVPFEREDDRDFPWGLLGLLGLAGLLGRKRDHDVHVHRTDDLNRR